MGHNTGTRSLSTKARRNNKGKSQQHVTGYNKQGSLVHESNEYNGNITDIQNQLKPATNKEYADIGKDVTTHSGKKQEHLDRESDEDGETDANGRTDGQLFPRCTPWLVVGFTLIFRLWYISDKANWWILHPDEVYQTLEVAHSEVYGYGFRAYEYLPPPTNSSHLGITPARANEVEMGMYSLRSFMLARVIALVMFLAEESGVNVSPFMVGKIFHVCVSSLLPAAVFRFSYTLYGSRDIAVVSCILAAASTLLNVFGTHSLINSFLSPFVFFSLTTFIRILDQTSKDIDTPKSHHSVLNNNSHKIQDSSSENRVHFPAEIRQETHTAHKCNSHNTATYQAKVGNDRNSDASHGIPTRSLFSPDTVDYNHNLVMGNATDHNLKICNENQSDFLSGLKQRNGDIRPYNGGYLTGNLWQAEQPVMSSHRTSKHMNGFATSKCHLPTGMSVPITGSLFPDTTNHLRSAFRFMRRNVPVFVSGLCLAVCIYVRPDVLLLPVCLGLFTCRLTCTGITYKLFHLRVFIAGFAIGFFIGGYNDFRSYGVSFISPVQWLKFNVWNNFSVILFGRSPCLFYFWNVVVYDSWHAILLLLLLVDVCFSSIVTKYKYDKIMFKSKVDNSVLYTVCILAGLYAFTGHKEARFFHNALVLLYVIYSRAIIRLYHATVNLLNQNNSQYYIYYLYICIALFSTSQLHSCIHVHKSNSLQWTYNGVRVSSHVNACLDFIRQQNDVTGVFVDRSIHMTGGYSLLHKNVPLIALMRNEFYEFGIGVRHTTEKHSLYTRKQSLTLFTGISDYISKENGEYLSKLLIKAPMYNYLVIEESRAFIDKCYTEVYRYGDSKVLHRETDAESQAYLDKLGINIPIGTNATVLEFEAHALLRHGAYNRAELKLLYGNRLDGSRLGTYQLLLELYRKYKGVYSRQQILKACTQIHLEIECVGRYIPFSLTR